MRKGFGAWVSRVRRAWTVAKQDEGELGVWLSRVRRAWAEYKQDGEGLGAAGRGWTV